MTRTNVGTIRERDKSRLSHAVGAKDIHQALDHIIKVVREDASIMSLCRLRTYLEHISKRHKEDLYTKFLEGLSSGTRVIDRLRITESQWARVERVSRRWASLYENPGMEHNVQPLVQDLSEFIGCGIQSFPTRVRGMESDLWDFRLLFPDIHLNFFDDEIHMIVVTDSRAGANEFSMIKKAILENEAAMKLTLVLVLGNNDQLREMATASSMEIVVLDEDDCKAIILSPNSRREFCHRVARRISVKALQPYQTQGKVRSRMFYGRQDEVKRVKNNFSGSFAIYGGRLVGKSSLLHRIGQEFEKYEEHRVCSITAQAFNSPVEVCRAILKKLHIPTATHRSILTFERLMRDNLASHTKRALILVDEVDDLIALDENEGYQVFETFHNLNSDFGERCRFIFAGYRDLAHHCMDSESRFRNFAEPIRLGNLDPLSARLLIEEPMCEELGFRFESDDLVEMILDMTAGHPNYIQVFCKELSESLESQQRRRVRLADIEQAFHNPDFRARVIETFHVNFSTLQKVMTALVVLEEIDEFGLPEVVKLLRSYGLKKGSEGVYKALRQLEMSFIIEQTGAQYHFIHRLFPDMLRKSVNLDSYIDVLFLELEQEDGQ